MGKKIEYINEWKRDHTKRFTFYINKETEKDVLDHFEKQPNKRAYLIGLIRREMKGDD